MKKDGFQVSVIIPVNNAELFVKRAIQSVAIFEEVSEIILVDDVSTDQSAEIIKSMQAEDARIILLSTGKVKPSGSATARNMGCRIAQSPFIAFLDVDDFYLPNRFQSTSKIFSVSNQIEAVIEPIKTKKNHFVISGSLAPKGLTAYELLLDFLRFNNRGPHLNGLTVKKEVLQHLKFDEELFYAQDTLFFIQLFLSFRVRGSHDSRPVASYVIHGENSIFKSRERRKVAPVLAKKILGEIRSDQPYAIRFYLFKRSLI